MTPWERSTSGDSRVKIIRGPPPPPVATSVPRLDLDALTQWLAQARAADARALARLLDTLFWQVAAVMRARLWRWPGAPDDANDIAQETVIRVARRFRTCAAVNGAQFLGWTFTIADHVMIDVIRSPSFRYEKAWRLRNRDAEIALDLVAAAGWNAGQDDEMDGSSAAPIASNTSTDSGAPPATDEGRRPSSPVIGRHAISRVVADLCVRTSASVLSLFYDRQAGATWAQIGAMRGITAGAAKRRFQRAQATLRRRILADVQTLPEDERRAATDLLASWMGWPTGRGRRVDARDQSSLADQPST